MTCNTIINSAHIQIVLQRKITIKLMGLVVNDLSSELHLNALKKFDVAYLLYTSTFRIKSFKKNQRCNLSTGQEK